MDNQLKSLLVSKISNSKWSSLTASDLDTGYASLTDDQKLAIIQSIANNDGQARAIIKNILSSMVSSYAKQSVDDIITRGTVDINKLSELI